VLDEAAAVAGLDALAAAEPPAALEVPEAGVLEEPEVLEDSGVPEVLEPLEEPGELLTGVRRDLLDERCLRERPPEVNPPVEVLSGETPAVEGAAAWGLCSCGCEPCPCGKRRACEAPPCGQRPPCDGSPCDECVPPAAVTCGDGWAPVDAP
jgi:hypothetical protein